MAGKHQIWSSNSKTKKKAKRCWRRQNKLRLQNEPTQEIKPTDKQSNFNAKNGDLVWTSGGDKPSTIGDLMAETKKQSEEVLIPENLTKEQMAAIVAKVDTRRHSYKQTTIEDVLMIDELWPVEEQFADIVEYITKSDFRSI